MTAEALIRAIDRDVSATSLDVLSANAHYN